MSRIEPYLGIIPSPLTAGVRVPKDRQRRQSQEHSRDSGRDEEETEKKPPADGKPHVDLKA